MKTKQELVTITPKKATELLKFNTYQGQRTLRQKHVKVLADKMKDGRFHLGEIAILKTPQETLLMNGQHTLNAGVVADVPFRAVLQTFEQNGDKPVDVARVFAQFDQHARRNMRDVSWIYAVELGWGDWPRAIVTLCARALGSLQSGAFKDRNHQWMSNRLPDDTASELMSTNKKTCEFVYSILGYGDHWKLKHMLRVPVVAAMIQSYRKCPEDAVLFWQSVRDGEMLRATSPEYRLREFLLNSRNREVKGAKQIVVPAGAIYRYCIVAWNAMRTKSPMPKKVYQDADIPKVK